MLENMNRMLQEAAKNGYGIPAPGVNDLQTVEAVFQAADELRSPVIIDCVPRNDIEAVAEITKFMSRRYSPQPRPRQDLRYLCQGDPGRLFLGHDRYVRQAI